MSVIVVIGSLVWLCQQRGYLCFEDRERLFDNLPDTLQTYLVVPVDQQVAKPDELPLGYLWVLLLRVLRKPAGSFPDNLKITNHCILQHRRGKKCRTPIFCIILDARDPFADV